MAGRKRKYPQIDPEYLAKEKEALVRRYPKNILFNERELSAIDEYCKRFKIKSKSSFFRQAIMEEVLKGLGENHPSLFEQTD